MVDILICSLPPAVLNRAPAAPAVLKACVEQAGFKAKTTDLALNFYINQCQKNYELYDQLCVYLNPTTSSYTNESINAVNQWLSETIDYINEVQPRYVGLSVFTYYMHRATYLLSREIKKKLPQIKIILGGYAVNTGANSLIGMPEISKLETLKMFGSIMQDRGLVDHVVYGDGENALVEILEGTKNHQYVSGEKAVMDAVMSKIPVSNFDDYKLNDYEWEHNRRTLTVTGSKGCVRQCTFCDIPGKYGRFKFRDGESIAQEMLTLKEKYGIRHFEFTDSLVNGSLKAFKQWLTVLAQYNDTQPDHEKIHWFGQYICRPKSQVKKEFYDLIKRSGVMSLIIGIESGNDETLKLMKKEITIDDVFAEFNMFQQYSIPITVLMLPGFTNETWTRYLDTLRFLVNCRKYYATGTIIKIGVSTPLVVGPGMKIHEEPHLFDIKLDPYDNTNWVSITDPSNTLVERIKRRAITQALLEKLKITVTPNDKLILKEINLKIHSIANEIRSYNS